MAHAHAQSSRERFQRDGFVVVRDVLPPQSTDFAMLQRRCEALFRGEFQTRAYPDEWHWREGMSLERQTKEICNAWKSDLVLADLVLSQHLAKLAGELMQWDSVRIAQDDVILKPPLGTAVGLHQDSDYISTNFELPEEKGKQEEDSSCLSVTMWIPLEPVDAGNGSLTYLKGSHKSSSSATLSGGFHSSPDSASVNTGGGFDEETLVMRPGDVAIHHERTWHFSRANPSSHRSRNVIVIHFLRGDVQFVERPTYIYARYKLYKSVALRDEFFPVVYPARSQYCIDYLAGALSRL